MFSVLPQRGWAYMSALAVLDAFIGTAAVAQSQTTMRRTVVPAEAARREESGCEDGDAPDGRCQAGLNALA